jgi:uncharacterized protein YqgV (UPF0045/DUF77 family)
MKISVEISYYPLLDEFVPEITGFIDRINTYKDLTSQTNGMSTQVFGEYKYVMNALTIEIEKAFENPHSVFVMKIINADLQVVEKW